MNFSRDEIKSNLLGCLEVALFMPAGPKRFGNTYQQAVNSFIVPALLFPASLIALSFSNVLEVSSASRSIVVMLLAMRTLLVWLLSFGAVAWILKRVDHTEHFYRFVIASNWLSIPATVIFIPVFWMVSNGAYSWSELELFILFLVFYTYAFSAYMAVYALVIPWELAWFFTMIAMVINDGTLNLVQWIGILLKA